MIYGYARVSTTAQDHAHQVAELERAGCERVFAESASGAAGKKRPQLRRLLAILKPGDMLTVCRLDRLGRSAYEILGTVTEIARQGVDFRSLREAWADTTTPAGRLMVNFMAGWAEFERELILERTAEGRTHAKARGVKMGRKPTLNRKQVALVRELRAGNPPRSIGELQAAFKVSRSTIMRALREEYQAAPTPAPQQVDIEDILAAQDEDPKD